MNYKRIYDQLIKKRVKQPSTQLYTQVHHIVPRSINPSLVKCKTNLVRLSFRQHYIAHALLVKIMQKSEDKSKYYKMLNAFVAMSKLSNNRKEQEKYFNSVLYSKFKIQKIKYILESGCKKGQNAYSYNKIIIHNLVTQKQMWISKDQQIPKGWQKGKSQKCIKRGQQTNTYGTKWIYNPFTLQQKLIKKEEQLPQSWQYGMSSINRQKMREKYSAPSKGKVWITNLQLRENKLIDKNQQLKQNWLYGRVSDFNSYLEKYNDALTQRKYYHFDHYEKDLKERKIFKIIKNRGIKYRTTEEKQQQKQEHINKYKIYFEQYKKNGYQGVIKNCNYNKSRNNLLNNFKKYFLEQYRNIDNNYIKV